MIERGLAEARAESPALPLASALFALVLSACPGVFLFPLILRRADFLLDNARLTPGERGLGAGLVLGSICLMLGLFALFGRRPGANLEAQLREWNRRTLWLLGLPLVALLSAPGIEVRSPVWTLLAVSGLAALAGSWAYRSDRLGPKSETWAKGLALALTLAYAALVSFFALARHWSLSSYLYDLGIYDNLVWNTSHGNFLGSSLVRGGSHLSAHFDPILLLLVPFYRLFPRAETLLVFQSVWLALGAIPLFWLARRKTKSAWTALAVVVVYLFYPALHGVNLYDFHSVALAIPLLVAAVAALEVGRVRLYALFVVLLLATREDLSLVVMGIGAYAIVALGRPRLGTATMGTALVYLLVVKLFVMTDPGIFMAESETSYGYGQWYGDLIPNEEDGALGMVLSLLSNPLFVLRLLTTPAKLLFFALLFVPLLFLPVLFGGRRLVVLAYGFAFLFLSSRETIHSIHYQYTSVFFPLAVALLPIALANFTEGRWPMRLGLEPTRLRRALSLALVVAAVGTSAKFGAIFPNESFRSGTTQAARKFAKRDRERYAQLAEALRLVPSSASVAATEKMVPHVSNRREVYVFPREADFLLVHEADLDEGRRRALEDFLRGDYRVVRSMREVRLLERTR